MKQKKSLNILIIIVALVLMITVSVISAFISLKIAENNFPAPAECDDPNAITFDDEDFSFASIDTTGKDPANGELTITEIKGNKMLKFNDDGTNFADNTVQKIKIDTARLLSPENLAKVRSIEMDIYADATSDRLVTENGRNVQAPGWIGGGAGANVANDKWYKFGDWESGEYNFKMSGAIHLELKFLLAVSGQHWESDMDEATLMLMRWGSQNEGNFYIDNIVFYDEDKNSLPIEKSEKPLSEE